MNKAPIGQCGSCQGYVEKCSSETFSALIASNTLLIFVGVAYIVFNLFSSRKHDLNVNLKIDKTAYEEGSEDGSEDGSEEGNEDGSEEGSEEGNEENNEESNEEITFCLSKQNENVFQQKVCCNFQYFDNCSLCNTKTTTEEPTEEPAEEPAEEPTETTTEELTETTTEEPTEMTTEDIIILN